MDHLFAYLGIESNSHETCVWDFIWLWHGSIKGDIPSGFYIINRKGYKVKLRRLEGIMYINTRITKKTLVYYCALFLKCFMVFQGAN